MSLIRIKRVSATNFTFYFEVFTFSPMYMFRDVKGEVAVGVDRIDIARTSSPNFLKEDTLCHSVLLLVYDSGIPVGKFKKEAKEGMGPHIIVAVAQGVDI